MIATEAWLWNNEASPLLLQKGRKDLPELGADDVLIENRAAGINPVDWKLIEGLSDAWKTGQIPGVDGTGIIVATGRNAMHFAKETRVMYHTDLRFDGSFSRYTVVAARAVMPVPEFISDAAAAALPCPGLTAAQAVGKVNELTGRNVLVNGAGGAVGGIIAQLLVHAGARVYATASPGHHETLMKRGVSGVFDYKDARWREAFRRTLNGQALYAVFDTVSGESAASLADLLGYYGHLVSIQDRLEKAPLPAFSTCISLHEVALAAIHPWGTPAQWSELCRSGAHLLQKVGNNALRLPKIETVSFDEIPNALQRLREGRSGIKYVAVF